MPDIFTPFLLLLGIGGVGGFLVGYTVKKVIKILMVLVGLYALSLFYLAYQEIIELNSGKLLEITSSLIAQSVGFLSSTIAYLPFSGSFAVGFALGVAKG
jgi:uncharacterized membrane protein (Fun14 family)